MLETTRSTALWLHPEVEMTVSTFHAPEVLGAKAAEPHRGGDQLSLIGEQLQGEIGALIPQIVEWRRQLHQYPEVAFHEFRTSASIHAYLSKIAGITVGCPTDTSVLGELSCAQPGPLIAIRADIDALPITEENEVDYRSTNDGVMHACGHDGHTAILLGLATLLARHRDRLPGRIRFIFQHAEELAPGGAQELVKAGVMDGVSHVIGLHLWSPLPVGQIGIIAGPAMAAPDNFELTIKGIGGHAAAPHQTVDPIAIGAQIVTALQNIVSRTVDPLDPVVISVTRFNAGTAFNIIPDTAHLAGTVRTFDSALRVDIPSRMEHMVSGIASAFGATCEFKYERGYEPVYNDPGLAVRLSKVVERTFGPDTLVSMRPSMGGEDFSAYQQRSPGVFAFVGARNEAAGITFPHHHPRFQIDESSLEIGFRYLTAAALELLSGQPED